MCATVLALLLATLSSSLKVVDQGQAKFAVVQPFSMAEVQIVAQHSAAIQCRGPVRLPIDYVMFYQGHKDDVVTRLNRTVEQVLTELMGNPNLFQCFAGYRLEYGNVSLAREYPQAPSDQFFAMMRMAPPAWGYSAIYQMELDVIPLRGDWLARILAAMAEELNHGTASVIGGVYTQGCMDPNDGKFNREETVSGFIINNTRVQHINGNAMYVLRPDFVEWMLPLQRKVEKGYDFFLFREMLHDRNRSEDTYRRTPLILDCKPAIKQLGNTVPTEEIARRYPDAVVAHTRFMENDPNTKTVLREPTYF